MTGAKFGRKLMLVKRTLALSSGQLALCLAVDKSIISRWLSGTSVPNEHNLARLTLYIAKVLPGFTMFDWELDEHGFAARLGLVFDLDGRYRPAVDDRCVQASAGTDPAGPVTDLPPFARLPAFSSAIHETASRGIRYRGLWRSWMPTFGQPDSFHCEHTVFWQEGAWLVGSAIGVSYQWPLIGFIANGQLVLMMSDASDFVLRQFNRPDEPIIDQIDGLMLAAASLPHQAPTACRVIMERVLHEDASRNQIEAKLVELAGERRFMSDLELPEGMAANLLPDSGPSASLVGGERLLRADPTHRLVKTRWY